MKLIAIKKNDMTLRISPDTTLGDLLADELNRDRPFACAVNAQFIPKVNYGMTVLKEGDEVQVVTPMQGG